MPPPPTHDLTVVRYAEGWGYAASEWLEALRAIDWTDPRAPNGAKRLKIRADADATVWQVDLSLGSRRHSVVLKVEPLDSPLRLVRSWLGWTKHNRQWQGAELLHARGIPAAHCLAILRSAGAGRTCEVLVTELLPGRSVLELLASGTLSVRRQHALARAVGRLYAKFMHQGLMVRDPKPSNILVTSWHDGQPTLAMVDTVDVRRGSMRPGDIIKGYYEPAGIGAAPRRSLALLAVRAMVEAGSDGLKPDRGRIRSAVRAIWSQALAEIRRRGDSTPADDPLRRDPD
ncbi:MAG: hypothetical protein Kow0022_07070 [Phycisphaerales bacterium]